MTDLDFKLTTRFNPENLSRKLRKVWVSTCKRYRIVWRKQYMRVAMIPRYFALRLEKMPDGELMWDFALSSERRPYKTFKRAHQACCRAAGIVLEETKPKRRKRVAVVSAQNLQTKRRGRPKGSKNKVKNG